MSAHTMGTGSPSTNDDPIAQLLAMFVLFNTITVRDGIVVREAHEAFLNIDEYAQTISPDTRGAK